MTSLGWSAFAIVATGLVLVSAFRDVVERRFDQTLEIYLSILIAELAEADEGTFTVADVDLGDPAFRLPLSGLYWLVAEANGRRVILTSQSLAGDDVELPDAPFQSDPGDLANALVVGPTGDELRLVSRRIAFGDGDWFIAAVAGSSQPIAAETAAFSRQLVAVLAGFTALLIVAVYVQWRISLRPLKRLGQEVEAVQEGRSRHVSETYPAEIAPLAKALNTLIDASDATLARARQHVGNLAHAMKTPLSVMTNDAAKEDGPLARSVREQSVTMQRQLRYYLDRAQMAARERTIGTVTDVGPALERLMKAMARLGEHDGVRVSFEAGPAVRFAGERQDFEEIAGNLVDNAIKWANSTVRVALDVDKQTNRKKFYLIIDDDGPGLSAKARQDVLSRGRRLDETKPGSGLGLSIVAELVEVYGGSLALDDSPAGGLRVVVGLPQA